MSDMDVRQPTAVAADAEVAAEVFASTADWVWARRFPDQIKREAWRTVTPDAVVASAWQTAARFEANPAKTAAAWLRSGLTIDQYLLWRPECTHPVTVTKWIRAGVTHPDLRQPWLDVGIKQGVHALRWVNAGVTDPDEAARLAETVPSAGADKWRKDGWDWEEIAQWQSAGIKSARDARWWVHFGFDIPTATAWRSIDVPPKTAALWLAHGHSASDVSEWLRATRLERSCWLSVTALDWLAGNWTPSEFAAMPFPFAKPQDYIWWFRSKIDPATAAEAAGLGFTPETWRRIPAARRARLAAGGNFHEPGDRPCAVPYPLEFPVPPTPGAFSRLFGPDWSKARLVPLYPEATNAAVVARNPRLSPAAAKQAVRATAEALGVAPDTSAFGDLEERVPAQAHINAGVFPAWSA